jgi:hypothetical protein
MLKVLLRRGGLPMATSEEDCIVRATLVGDGAG